MIAEIVSVGSELLLGQITDTNCVDLARALAESGVSCLRRQTVGDNRERLAESLRLALGRADIVITIGGLGPTEDDLTREGIADAIGEELVEDPSLAEEIRTLFERRGLKWLDTQRRQAMLPLCGRALPNPNGTAPGLICEKSGKAIIAMPGPRGEFLPMLENHVRPYLEKHGEGRRIRSRVLRLCGIGESMAEELVRPLLRNENPTLAPLAHLGEVHLRMTAQAATEAEALALLNSFEPKVRECLGDVVFGTDDITLEAAVVEMLREEGKSLAVAESCTGGLLGGRFTSVPGSSDVFIGGFITYRNQMKVRMLGVPEDLLQSHGAVSEECALAMAEGARRTAASDLALSITGIAGPDGGTEEKPVGLVYIAVVDASGARAFRNQFLGGREDVRRRSTQFALTLLRKTLLAGSVEGLK